MNRGQFGFTVMELLVVMGIIGAALAVAIPNLNRRQLDLSTASQGLESEIRLARAYSISRGAHLSYHYQWILVYRRTPTGSGWRWHMGV